MNKKSVDINVHRKAASSPGEGSILSFAGNKINHVPEAPLNISFKIITFRLNL